MVNGLYSARNSMMLLQDKLDNNAHNLANASTTGFKKSIMVTTAQVDHQRNDEYKLHQDENQKFAENRIVWQQGPLQQTDNLFDVALEGDGLFMVQDPDEGIKYTRNGAWTLNGQNELSTLNGMKILDKSGSPIILEDLDFGISKDGNIYQNGDFVGSLNIVEFENPDTSLRRTGKNAFELVDPEQPPKINTTTKVAQGMLEGSNVSTVDSMVEMIRIARNNDFSSKMVTSIDETIGKAVNEVARVS